MLTLDSMLTRRNWLLRTSIVLNVVVLCYVGSHLVSYNSNGNEFVEDMAPSGRSLASVEYNTDSQSSAPLLDPSSNK